MNKNLIDIFQLYSVTVCKSVTKHDFEKSSTSFEDSNKNSNKGYLKQAVPNPPKRKGIEYMRYRGNVNPNQRKTTRITVPKCNTLLFSYHMAVSISATDTTL